MTIDDILDEIIVREGGYVYHPEDRGGPTKYGITMAALSEFAGRPVTRLEVENLSPGTAREIYRQNYVTRPGLDKIQEERLRHQVIDASVHHGPKMAVKLLQRAANFYGAKLNEDGILGPATLAVANSGESLVAQMCRERLAFVSRIVRDHPDQLVFLVGWVERITRFLV